MGVLHQSCVVRDSISRRSQFERRDCTGPYPSGNCRRFKPSANVFETIDTLSVRRAKYRIKFNERWIACGYLAIFMFGMQFLHSFFFKTSKVVKR